MWARRYLYYTYYTYYILQILYILHILNILYILDIAILNILYRRYILYIYALQTIHTIQTIHDNYRCCTLQYITVHHIILHNMLISYIHYMIVPGLVTLDHRACSPLTIRRRTIAKRRILLCVVPLVMSMI